MDDLLRFVDAYTLSISSEKTVPKSSLYSDSSSRASKKPKIKEVQKSKLNSTQDSVLSGKYSVYIHYSREENKKPVEELAIFLRNQGFKVEGIERINYKNIDVRYFHGEDKSAALLLKKKLIQFINLYTNLKNTSIKTFNLGHKYPNAKKGALELWVSF